MENAGSAVAEFILQEYPHAERIGVICGKGNNGGDGLVCARKLHEAGKQVSVLLLADPSELKGDAAEMYKRLAVPAIIARNEDEFSRPEAQAVYDQDLLVDAILGTGFKPPVTGLYERAIEGFLPRMPVVSVDVPSGVDADELEIVDTPGDARVPLVGPQATITFTAPKPANVFPLLGGCTFVAPIGSPQDAFPPETRLSVITPSDTWIVPARLTEAHKGDFGHVLVIGGSVGKAGAAAMAGMAALRSGAGLVTVACPRSVLPTVAGFAPEMMTEPLEETEAGTISLRALEYNRIDKLLQGKTIVVLGPGASRHPETAEFVRTLVDTYEVPVVLDADGLNAFEGRNCSCVPRRFWSSVRILARCAASATKSAAVTALESVLLLRWRTGIVSSAYSKAIAR
jgi:NAD(P)H-hydrate epimerase